MDEARWRQRRQWAGRVAAAAVVLVLASGVVLGALSPYFVSSDGVAYGLDGGPTVVTDKQYSITSGAPYDSSTTVNITTENNGRATFQSSGDTEVTIDDLEGTFSNFSAIDATAASLRIDPGDKAQATVGGGVTALDFRDGTVNDSTIDFVYTASGEGRVKLKTNGTTDKSYGLLDVDSGQTLDVGVADSSGRINFDGLESGTHRVRIIKLGKLVVREEGAGHRKINNVRAEFKFFEDQDDDPVIVNRTSTNGGVDLTGLPVDEEFVVQIKAGNGSTTYHNRTLLLPDLGQQDTAFLINKNETTVENRFVVRDATGEFPPSSTEIIIQHAINDSLYGAASDSADDGYDFENVGGDDLGADEAYVIDLAEGERYRIKVQNEAGDVRILGAYTPETGGTIDLNVGEVAVDPEADPVPRINSFRNNTSRVFVTAEYNDSTRETDEVFIEIYNRSDRSDVLFSNTSFAGPLGNVKVVEPVPPAENDTEWVTRVTYDRGGEQNQQQEIVGPRGGDVVPGMANWLRAVLSIGSLILVAGLFSQLNGAIGGLVVASLGGLYWFVGFLPDSTGVGVVVLALVAAGAMFINETKDGGFG